LSTEGIIVSAVILALSLAWLAQPFVRRRFSVNPEELARQKEREILLTTYERTLTAIRDLDEDRLTGKLSQTDYETERSYWMQQGVVTLQALEKIGGKPARQPKPARREKVRVDSAVEVNPDAALDDAVEQAIANYIQSKH
jgi:hypothetical protein